MAFGLKNAIKNPSLNKAVLDLVCFPVLISKFALDLKKPKATYNMYEIPTHLKTETIFGINFKKINKNTTFDWTTLLLQ